MPLPDSSIVKPMPRASMTEVTLQSGSSAAPVGRGASASSARPPCSSSTRVTSGWTIRIELAATLPRSSARAFSPTAARGTTKTVPPSGRRSSTWLSWTVSSPVRCERCSTASPICTE